MALSVPPATQAEAGAASELSKLGSTVSYDLRTVQSDLEEARRLTAAYQAEAAGKATELASMTLLFEKTRKHLIQLQLSVTNLRDERHRLANRAMETDALQRKLTMVTLERDRLQQELQAREKWQG